jgi:aldose 1-epimerase
VKEAAVIEGAPQIDRETRDGLSFDVLREPATGSEAKILPEIGANCVQFRTSVEGRPLDVIRPPPSWEAFRAMPVLWGSAVLFPFPGRIREGRFRFGGNEYQLSLNETSLGNALHGCVSTREWTRIESSANPRDGAAIVYRIGTDEQPRLLADYPFPFRLTMEIRLKAGRLRYSFTAENLGDRLMPVGLGLHPYFPLPLGDTGSSDDCEIWVDAPYYWEQEGYVPVGTSKRAEHSVDLRQPRSLRGLASVGIGGPDRMVNLVHSQFADDQPPRPSHHGIRWGLRNPRSNREVVVQADAAFPASVTFVPPSRDRVSFEPHTCLPNAFNLTANRRVAGTATLLPGEFWRGSLSVRASTMTSNS